MQSCILNVGELATDLELGQVRLGAMADPGIALELLYVVLCEAIKYI